MSMSFLNNNNKEKRERILTPGEAYRSNLVYKISEVDTPAALERQLGTDVLDAEALARRGVAEASAVLQNVIGVQPPETAHAMVEPNLMDPADRALIELGYTENQAPATPPLPGFEGQQPPMPPIGANPDDYRLAA
jgi:hypothetical protein